MRRRDLGVLLALAAAAAVSEAATADVAAILREFDRMASAGGASLWPGFDPRSTPLALFDGERTWLVRHPQPPAVRRRATGFWRSRGS